MSFTTLRTRFFVFSLSLVLLTGLIWSVFFSIQHQKNATELTLKHASHQLKIYAYFIDQSLRMAPANERLAFVHKLLQSAIANPSIQSVEWSDSQGNRLDHISHSTDRSDSSSTTTKQTPTKTSTTLTKPASTLTEPRATLTETLIGGGKIQLQVTPPNVQLIPNGNIFSITTALLMTTILALIFAEWLLKNTRNTLHPLYKALNQLKNNSLIKNPTGNGADEKIARWHSILKDSSIKDWKEAIEKIGAIDYQYEQHLILYQKALLTLEETHQKYQEVSAQLEGITQQLEASNENESTFLAHMSHELRSPLNSILGFTTVLSSSTLQLKQKEYLAIIQKSSKTLLTLINQILDYSKLEAGKLALEHVPFNFRETTEEVLEMLSITAHEKQLELINLQFIPSTATFYGDPLRLNQILINLINNAIKFTDRGCVTVRTTCLSESDKKMKLKISITDTGIGLTESEKNNIFKKFGQGDASSARKYGGSGLGLVISQGLAHQMGGDIDFHSEYKSGSTFWFTVNLSTCKPNDALDINPDLLCKRILLFDHNPMIRLSIRNILNDNSLLGDNDMISEASSMSSVFEQLSASLSPNHSNDSSESNLSTPFSFIIFGRPEQKLSTPELKMIVSTLENDYNVTCLIICCNKEFYELHENLVIDPCQLISKPVTYKKIKTGLESTLELNMRNQARQQVTTNSADTTPTIPLKEHLPDHLRDRQCLEKNGLEKNNFPPLKQPETHDRISELEKTEVLCVDDNLANLQLIDIFLQDLGVSVTTASSGQEAVALATQKEFDLIFMDIQMPELNGLQTTQKIRTIPTNQYTPILALTAHAMADEKEEMLKSGMNDYMTKPISVAQLKSALLKFTAYELWLTDTEETGSSLSQKVNEAEQTLQHKPENSPQSLPIFDEAEHLQLCNHKIELADELFDMFISSLKTDSELLRNHWQKRSFGDLQELTHKVHGATRYCGVPALRAACSDMETVLKQSQTSQYHALFKHLDSQIIALLEFSENQQK